MKIKKYIVDKESLFATSLVLPFYEKGNFGFHVDGLEDSLRRELFHTKYLKYIPKSIDIDPKSLPTYCYIVYLDEYLTLKALILYSSIKKLYYCFKVDNNDDQKLRLQPNYISSDISLLTKETEKSFKKKGINYYDGEGDYSRIKDLNFFDFKHFERINPRIDKKSNISRLIFTKNNKFTADFIHKVYRNNIIIVNKDKLAMESLASHQMEKLKNNRKDCLFINFSTGSIEYFIYTYRPQYVNHYLLFKNLGNNRFEFISESIVFNALLLRDATKELYFKEGSEFASTNLSNMDYDDFLERYIEFSEDEEVDDEFDSEWKLLEQLLKEVAKELSIDQKVYDLLESFGYSIDNNILYFKDYESIPLAAIGDGYIKIKQNRLSTDLSLSNQISLKDFNKIEKSLMDLLHNKPSSRLLSLDELINDVIKKKYNKDDEEQSLLIEDIEDSFKTLWPIDRKYPVNYLTNLLEKYRNWKSNNHVDIESINVASKKKKKDVVLTDINITLHAGIRIKERIGKMKEEEMKKLASEAYAYGFNSVHFLETDYTMFRFLQYQQNKYPGKTLRLYNDFVYIYSLKPPHDLITCFPVQENYKRYIDYLK